MNGPFIAIDWGTTNRRLYWINEGAVTRTERDEVGILSVSPNLFANEVERLRYQHGDVPLVCVGMIGSKRGWHETPYVPVPASLADLARAAVQLRSMSAVLTAGLSLQHEGRADVMRGEEIQFLGAVITGLAPTGALLCQPGTHCKWARAAGESITEFSSAMTGELHNLLRQHSLLGDMLTDTVADGPAFREGVREAGNHRLLTSLFGARAAWLLDARPKAEGASYVSGLLIGTDVRAQARIDSDETYVIGDAPLAPLYAAAIREVGGRARLVDGASAFVAGVSRLWELVA